MGPIVTKLVESVLTGGEMRSMHFMPVVAFDSFQMSVKNKAPYWMKVDILKYFSENLSYLSFEIVDV